jgi:hypothetical protein
MEVNQIMIFLHRSLNNTKLASKNNIPACNGEHTWITSFCIDQYNREDSSVLTYCNQCTDINNISTSGKGYLKS